MRKLFLFVALLCSLTFGQGWNSTVQTTINEPNLVRMDLFTNRDGNHALIMRSNGKIVYYNFNSSGTVDNNKTVTLETNGDFPNIVGSSDRVYALYKTGNYIKGKYSSNGGSSWTNIPDRSINPYPVNGVDAVFQDGLSGGVHLVWATKDGWNPPYDEGTYETYYYRLPPDNSSWTNGKNVTDYNQDEMGGFPTVSFSANRVHVSYNTSNSDYSSTSNGVAKTRDKYFSSWQTPQSVYSDGSARERVQAGSSKLLDLYYKFVGGMGQYHYELYSAERTFSQTTWSNHQQLYYFAGVEPAVSSANTTDGKTHIVYEIIGGVGYRNYNGSSWSSEFTLGSGYYSPQISSVSNDVFVAWSPENYPNNYLNYRQYDVAPLTPSNLSITTEPSGYETILSWAANTEPDVKNGGKYKIYRAEWGLTGEPTSYDLVATINAYNGDTPVTSWQDEFSGKSSARKLFYKISARDVNLHESPLSNYVWRYGKIPKIGNSNNEIAYEYELMNSYPNPFNPSTKIVYSLAEDSKVQIKVYDMLGTEVAELVNEEKTSGIYETIFDASNLSSGVYVYRISALKGERLLFSESKRMILMK